MAVDLETPFFPLYPYFATHLELTTIHRVRYACEMVAKRVSDNSRDRQAGVCYGPVNKRRGPSGKVRIMRVLLLSRTASRTPQSSPESDGRPRSRRRCRFCQR